MFFLLFALWTVLATAFEVPISDTDWNRQVCSGMWGGEKAHINVTFEPSSQGQVSVVIYEWRDAPFLGKETSKIDDTLPKTYVCTASALSMDLCNMTSLGHFIFDLPSGKTLNDTSFWEARIGFKQSTIPATPKEKKLQESLTETSTEAGFWNNPAGNPTPPPSPYYSPPKAARWSTPQPLFSRQKTVPSIPSGPSSPLLTYRNAIQYNVDKTGYYCVGVIPLTVDSEITRRADNPHPGYTGSILFRNTFDGKLPASDYPKVNFYFSMLLAHAVFGVVWAFFCYKYKEELLPIQYHISGLVGFLLIENVASWIYYRYLNAHGSTTTSTVFLFVVAILDAGRNALSLFLLLIVCLGLSVVRESLGRTMLRCRILTVAHFVFGVLYAIGIVKLELESTSALILLFFVIPLAFTLSGFMLWIMYALNGTVAELRSRKQHYKLGMFSKLYYILLATIFSIVAFFVASSFQFSDRLAEDYASRSWQTRWWYLDGFLVLLYLFVFWSIAFLWRPTEHNRRLAMSEELAQDENDAAEDYEFDSLQRRRGEPDEEENIGRVHGANPHPPGEEVVFEIGDQDSDEEDDSRKRSGAIRLSGDERAGLISSSRKDD